VQAISGQGSRSKAYAGHIAAEVSPHYHLAAGGEGFYRLSPYRNARSFITHFISVAPFT
jgi:hypothetical protein